MPPRFRFLLLALAGFLLSSCASKPKVWDYEYSRGRTGVVVNGKAVPPAGLPAPVMRAISAGNRIAGKPYKFGGGHRSFEDWGYDCSGTVSYVLHAAGLLSSPGTSSSLRSYGKSGEGKHITVYSRNGHTFIVVAGMRLDTGYNGERKGPRWSTKSRPMKGYLARHPPGL
ncbi:MAG TPA: peptidoglycan endopeptidase [Prosthecobacter sp.]